MILFFFNINFKLVRVKEIFLFIFDVVYGELNFLLYILMNGIFKYLKILVEVSFIFLII